MSGKYGYERLPLKNTEGIIVGNYQEIFRGERMKKNVWTELPPDRDNKIFGIFTRERNFYRTFFPLLFIISLQQLTALTADTYPTLTFKAYAVQKDNVASAADAWEKVTP